MDLIKLLDVANPKKIKDTLNILIENYENFGDRVQGIADKAAEDSAAALAAGNEAKQIAQENTESLEQSIVAQNTQITEAITAQNTEITEAITAQGLKLDNAIAAQDALVSQSAEDSANAKQIAEEALAMIEQADARSEEATALAEQAIATADEATATSELAMNVATEAKSTVDQAISTGVFGTFVHNSAGISLLHAYMTDDINAEDTDERFHVATPKLVREALNTKLSPTDLKDYTYSVTGDGYWVRNTDNTISVAAGAVTNKYSPLTGTVQDFGVLTRASNITPIITAHNNIVNKFADYYTAEEINTKYDPTRLKVEGAAKTVDLGANVILGAVAYGNGVYVALPAGSNVFGYSTDGINWTRYALSQSANFTAVHYAAGKFIAVCRTAGTYAYSTNGLNWTFGTLPKTTQQWRSITYGNGKWVVVGRVLNSADVLVSEDGINWTVGTITRTYDWMRVIYAAGKFVAIHKTGAIAYSEDGLNWTESTISSTYNQNWYDIAYGNGRFVAMCAGGWYIAAYSEDAINWTVLPEKTLPVSAWHLLFDGTRFVGVNANTLITSTDGINWARTDLDISPIVQTYTNGIPVTCSEDKLIVAGEYGRLYYKYINSMEDSFAKVNNRITLVEHNKADRTELFSGSFNDLSNIPDFVTTNTEQIISANKVYTGQVITPSVKNDESKAKMFIGANNELDFDGLGNVLYIGYNNPFNSESPISQYHFGRHTGGGESKQGEIYAGKVFVNNGTEEVTTKNYVDNTALAKSGGTMSGAINMNGNYIRGTEGIISNSNTFLLAHTTTGQINVGNAEEELWLYGNTDSCYYNGYALAKKNEIPDISPLEEEVAKKADLTNTSQTITAHDIVLQGYSMFNYCADLGGRGYVASSWVSGTSGYITYAVNGRTYMECWGKVAQSFSDNKNYTFTLPNGVTFNNTDWSIQVGVTGYTDCAWLNCYIAGNNSFGLCSQRYSNGANNLEVFYKASGFVS